MCVNVRKCVIRAECVNVNTSRGCACVNVNMSHRCAYLASTYVCTLMRTRRWLASFVKVTDLFSYVKPSFLSCHDLSGHLCACSRSRGPFVPYTHSRTFMIERRRIIILGYFVGHFNCHAGLLKDARNLFFAFNTRAACSFASLFSA